MCKRILKAISAVLVLAMLTEMLPMTLLGNFVQRVAAAEKMMSWEEEEVHYERPSSNDWKVEIPPTLIESTSEIEKSEILSGTAENDGDLNIASPYRYQYNEHETVSMENQLFSYQEVDYVLPGVNGLDLVIGHRFTSLHCDYYSATTSLFRPAIGWELMFSWMDLQYLYLSDGRSFPITREPDHWGSHLGGSSRINNIILKKCCTPTEWEWSEGAINYVEPYENGSEYATFCAIYGDGKREYFNSKGELIGIVDRYGNEITLVSENVNGRPQITITDTLGRVITIYRNENQALQIDLPENKCLLYSCTSLPSPMAAKGYYLMESYQNANGEVTYYSYTKTTGKRTTYASGEKEFETVTFYPLTTITHLNGLQTVFTYELRRQYWEDTYCALQSRADCIDGMEHNRIAYGQTVEYASGLRWEQVYESGRLRFEKYYMGDQKIKQINYSYKGSGPKPWKKTTTWFSVEAEEISLSATELYEYDFCGNITEVWSTLAEGEAYNEEYKREYRTLYSYDKAYGLLLTKSYKTDINTTVELRNTLDSEKKSVLRTEIYVNSVLKGRTDYTYDSHGNVTSEKHYHDDFTTFDQIEYAYQNNAYLAQEKHTGILTADGGSAVSTPGQAAGTVATSYTYDTLGRMTSTTDGSGNTTSYTYDALGNVTQTANPDGTTVRYARNYTKNTLTVTDENGAQVKYTYTPLGLEFETVDVQTGSVISRKEYDSISRLSKVSDFVYGAVTEYAYDALDRVVSETIKQGEAVLAQTLYAYDDAAENGQYRKVTKTVVGDENAPSIVTTQYTDKNGNVVKTGKFLDGVEYFDTAAYDYVGNVITQLTADAAARDLPFTAKYEYNENGQVIKTYNAESQYTTNSYNALGQLVQTTDYAGTPTVYTYDALGRLLTQTITIEDGVTATSKYDYDASGNIIREYKPIHAVGSAEAWSKTEYAYNNRQKLTQVKQYDGNTVAGETSYTYDGVGNMLTMTAGGNTTTYTYDRFGNTLTMTDALGQTETYTYTTLGKPLTKTDRNGTITSYTHDALGRTISTTAGTGESAESIQCTYTKTGQVSTEENGWQRTAYAYDELGRTASAAETELTVSDSSAGNMDELISYTKTYAYDLAGNRTGFRLVKGTETVQDVAYTYDSLNRLSTVSENGSLQATYTYDANGNRASLTYTNGTEETYAYNKANWITNLENKKGGNILSSYRYTYYASGSQKTETDHTGKVTSYVYDGLGRLIEETTPVKQTTPVQTPFTVTLDPNGGSVPVTTVQVTNGEAYNLPEPVRTGYLFDGWYLGEQRISNGDTVHLTEDSTLTAHWTPITYTIVYNCGDTSAPASQIATYDEAVILAEAPEREGSSFLGWSLTADGQAQFAPGSSVQNLAEEQGSVVTLYAVWDAAVPTDQFTITLDPSGGSVAVTTVQVTNGETYNLPEPFRKGYLFDGWYLGERLISNGGTVNLTEDSTFTARWTPITYTISYDLNGHDSFVPPAQRCVYDVDVKLYTPSGFSNSYTFLGWSRRPTGLVQYRGGSTVRNLTAINGDTVVLYAIWKENGGGIVKPIEPPPDLEIMSLHADSASDDGSDYILTTYTYTYDQAGNRASLTATGAENYTIAYTYDANNRLLTEAKAENGETITTTYTYDANGNTLTKSTPAHGEKEASNTVYTYNGFSQLTGLTINGTTVAYAYNAQGIRTAKRVNNLRTAFLLDGGNVVAEVQNNTITDAYLRGVNLIRREAERETEYYLFNAHGDVVTTTNPNGTVSHSYDYDAFGNEKNPDPLDSNPFRYCGEYLDAETGSYYLRARYYDPTIGRFTQQDTHWNTVNMIYGDNPQKINEWEDKLGLTTYSYAPQIMAVMQSGNLYAYGINNPTSYCDQSGQFLGLVLGVFFGIEVTVELVCTVIGLTIATIAAIKITQQAIMDLAEYLDVTTERAKWLIEKAQGVSDESSMDDDIDSAPSDNHTTTTKNPGPTGKPNSSVDIVDKDGNVVTRRWYDEHGRAYKDVDMTNHGNPKTHPNVPHEHHWDWSDPKHPNRIP